MVSRTVSVKYRSSIGQLSVKYRSSIGSAVECRSSVESYRVSADMSTDRRSITRSTLGRYSVDSIGRYHIGRQVGRGWLKVNMIPQIFSFVNKPKIYFPSAVGVFRRLSGETLCHSRVRRHSFLDRGHLETYICKQSKNIQGGPVRVDVSWSVRLIKDKLTSTRTDQLTSAPRQDYIAWRELVRTGHMIKAVNLVVNRREEERNTWYRFGHHLCFSWQNESRRSKEL